ncbi:hypothetical protein GQX60_01375 [Brachyspira hyodysenteriae]|uniref:hypothetical protein n=1 Tax=Brachyspira hyodysenteriae TaxID=159 RepID=UPI001ADDDD4A|nr:hypothetical protein [Brachyspira hyodysenteriae]QTM07564.1 hypothetical protein GQX60_01375 [Brachyspira hyodysenteriae]
MRIKKRLIANDNYYEYSSSYIRKYIVFIAAALFILLFVVIFIHVNYRVVPSKSYMRNDTPVLDGNVLTITNNNGVYYTGDFTNILKSIHINDNMVENLYLYLFHDNHIIFWKLYKYGLKRYFSYYAFNILDGDSQSFIIKENEKDFLDFYDNFVRAQFRKNVGELDIEIPNFYNTKINIKSSISNLINAKFSFKFTNFSSSMVNWKYNKALYTAFYYGLPSGYLIVPGSENAITDTSSVIAINTVGENPSRYTHNIISALVYTSYTTEPIPVFIYDSKPESQNSRMIKFLFNNKWYVYKNFESHEYKDVIDYYSKEEGFSFVFTVTGNYLYESFGSFSRIDMETTKGVLDGYFTINNEQFNINGNAVKEFVHSVF